MITNCVWHTLKNSKYRLFFWPFKQYEMNKFLSMACLMFCILLNLNLARNITDTLVIIKIGTEIISYLKIWGELPMGILFVLLYTYLCNVMSTESIFRYVVCFFLGFFAFFAFVLFPHQDFFHPDPNLVQYYITAAPHLKWFIVIWGKWSYALFYILGELWAVVVFVLFFWQLANSITTTKEAKKSYVFFNLFGQSNLLFSGTLTTYLASKNNLLQKFFAGLSHSDDESLIKSIALCIIISGILCLMIHRYIEVKHIKSFKPMHPAQKEIKLHLSFIQSIKIVLTSRYLVLICIVMIVYSMAVTLTEGLWLSRARALYPSAKDFLAYRGMVSFRTGIVTLIFAFVGNTIVRSMGWLWGAMITPLMIFGVGILFFGCFMLSENRFGLSELFTWLHSYSDLSTVVYMGTLQNILGKGAKYALFDATKELLYIPLSNEIKTRGKAAVDILGPKIGKLVGSHIQCIAFSIYPMAHHEDIASLLMVSFLVTGVIWIGSVWRLHSHYQLLLKSSNYTDNENNKEYIDKCTSLT